MKLTEPESQPASMGDRPEPVRQDSAEEIDYLALGAAIATISAVGVAIGLSFPLLSFLLEQRGYSSTLIGANTAMAGIASIIAVPFVNPLARRIGLVNTLCAAALLAAASLMAFYFFSSIIAWFLLRIALHGAITASFVLSEYWINSAAPEKKRGLVLGVYATVLSIGFACGPALLALLGTQGIKPFVVGSAIILVSIIPPLFARSRQPRTNAPPSSSSVVRYLWIVPAATAAAFIFGAVEQSGLALFPVYGARTGYTETQISLLLVALAIGNVVFQIPLGLLSDRMRDRRTLLTICASVGALGAAILPFVTELPIVLSIGIFIWGGVTAGMYTVGLAHLGSRLSGADLAQANAAFVLSYAIGMVIGPQLTGLLMDFFDPHGFAFSLCAMFLAFVALAMFRGRAR